MSGLDCSVSAAVTARSGGGARSRRQAAASRGLCSRRPRALEYELAGLEAVVHEAAAPACVMLMSDSYAGPVADGNNGMPVLRVVL